MPRKTAQTKHTIKKKTKQKKRERERLLEKVEHTLNRWGDQKANQERPNLNYKLKPL